MTVTDVSPKPHIEPTYLGDGLYATFDGYMIELYSHNGVEKLSSVYLELPVYMALRSYAARIWELEP
jgi:hypothetical protein